MSRSARRALQSFGALFSSKTRSGRLDIMKKLFDDQVLEFTEDNIPTNIVTFFEDMIRAIPHSALEDNDVEALFQYAVRAVKEK